MLVNKALFLKLRKMAKYKVIVIAHQLKNNKIAKSGETVDESELNGNAKDLVKAGFIVPADVKKDAPKKSKASKSDAKK